MIYRQLGKTNLKISEIGHGTWTMGGHWGARNDREAINSLVCALKNGINFFDTAAVYGYGHSESLIASAQREAKKKAIVATKIPPKNHRWPADPQSSIKDVFPYDHIIEQTELSLKNLRQDYVDIQQLHVWTDAWLNQTEWLEALAKLKKEGKIRFLGVSINDHNPLSALGLVKSGLIDTVQVIYNIFDQSAEESLFPLCLTKEIGIIVRVPFDEGSLTGQLNPHTIFHKKDWRSKYFTPERLVETTHRIEQIKKELKPYALELDQAALKFCLHPPAVSTVIPGMKTEKHVLKNILASNKNNLPTMLLTQLKKHEWKRNFYPY